jgi:hypothetical protein
MATGVSTCVKALRSTCTSSTSDLPKKIVSPERLLVLPFDCDKYKALSVRLETVRLNGVCITDLIKSLVDAVNKLSEDVTQLKSDNVSLISELKNLEDSVSVRPLQVVQQPQGSSSSTAGPLTNNEVPEPAKAASQLKPTSSYAEASNSGTPHTAATAEAGFTVVRSRVRKKSRKDGRPYISNTI